MGDIITKERINMPKPFNFALKVDIPIWEEFAIGLEYFSSWARNNKFRGVRVIDGRIPNSDVYVAVCIVTHTPSEQKFFHNVVYRSYKKDRQIIKEEKFDRLNKEVYIIKYKFLKRQ